MGLFDKLESRLEHGVNGAFARAFKSEVQPVELAAGMRRAMDDRAASIGKGKRPIVPNLYTFELSPTDYARLAAWGTELDDELIAAAQEHADEQRYIPGGPFTIVLDEADDLETGVFRLRPTTAKAAEARAFAAQHPRYVPEPVESRDGIHDERENGHDYDDFADEHDSYGTYDDYDTANTRENFTSHSERRDHDEYEAPHAHGASRLEDYSRDERKTHSRVRDDDNYDTYREDHDEYVRDDEGDQYATYDGTYDEHDTHTVSSADPYAKGEPVKNGTLSARVKNYLFGNYAPEPSSEHADSHNSRVHDERTSDSHDAYAADDYYPEHEADSHAQADHTSYDAHYGEYETSDEYADETSVTRRAPDDLDDPYEYEHTRPAPQKAPSRPVRELPKKREKARVEPVTEDSAPEQYDDYPAQTPENEHHSGYISYDPEAEYTQRGGYTTYGDADVVEENAFVEEGVEAPRERPAATNIKRSAKREEPRSYAHNWDDDDDEYGDPTGYEPAPSKPAPARRAVSPRERPWLKIDGQRYPLMGAITVIGRDDDADIILDDPGVSRRHSEVRITHDGPHLVMSIRDLGSTNGTYINGDRVEAEHLHDGDRVTVGRTSMTIHLGDRP